MTETATREEEPRIYISYSYVERPQSRKNLEYFLRHGVQGFDNITVDLVTKGAPCGVRVGGYPNVAARHEENVGYDFGTHSQNLARCDLGGYDYFILMNCSCTGPFRRQCDPVPWYRPFVRRVAGSTKLVGSSVLSVRGPGPTYRGPLPYTAGPRCRSPGGWFMLTDAAGAGVLREMLGKYNIRSYNDAHAVEYLTGRWMRERGYEVAGLIKGMVVTNRFESVIVKTRTCRDNGVGAALRRL